MDHRARLLTSPQQPASPPPGRGGIAATDADRRRRRYRSPARPGRRARCCDPVRPHPRRTAAAIWPGRRHPIMTARSAGPWYPGRKRARQTPRWWCRARRAAGRGGADSPPGAVLQYVRHYGRQPRVHPAGGTRRPDRGPRRQEGPGRPWFPVRQPRRHSRRAGSGTGAPGPPAAGQAALVPASGRTALWPAGPRPGPVRPAAAARPQAAGRRAHACDAATPAAGWPSAATVT